MLKNHLKAAAVVAVPVGAGVLGYFAGTKVLMTTVFAAMLLVVLAVLYLAAYEIFADNG